MVNLGITKTMVKLRKHGLRFLHHLFKKKNINNGSGDNNNNSNDGEKTMVLDYLAKCRLFGDTVRTGADPMEPDIKRYHIKQLLTLLTLLTLQQQQWQRQQLTWQEELELELLLLMLLTLQQQQRQRQRQWQRQQLTWQEKLELELQWQQRLLKPQRQQLPTQHQQWQQPKLSIEASDGGGSSGDGDGGGSGDGDGGSGGDGDGGDDGSNSGSGGGNGSCDDGNGDNNGGGKTEGGGGDGGKMESKGQHDNRNRFSYHGGDENGYPVGQLHRCYYEKTNVCSVIPIQRKNINNGSGVNNNNSNEGEETKEMVLGLPPKRGQTLSKAVEETAAEAMVRYMAELEAVLAPSPLEAEVAAGGYGSGGDGGGGSGGGGDDGDGVDYAPMVSALVAVLSEKLKSPELLDSAQLEVMAAEVAAAIMMVGIKLKAVAEAVGQWVRKRSPRVNTITVTDYQKPNVCSIIPYQVC